MTGVVIPTFSAAQGRLRFHTGPITFDASTALVDETYGSTVVNCKSITVTPPKGEIETVQLLGETATTIGAGIPSTGTFQNVIFDEKSYSEATMSCTMVFSAAETNIPDFLILSTGTGQAITGYKRHTFGDSTNNQKRIINGAVLLDVTNSNQAAAVLFNNPYFNVGDLKPTGMDGHFEIDFECKCLPQDFAMDVKNE